MTGMRRATTAHITARITPEVRRIAARLGHGNVSAGVRESLLRADAADAEERRAYIRKWMRKNMNRFPELYARGERDQ